MHIDQEEGKAAGLQNRFDHIAIRKQPGQEKFPAPATNVFKFRSCAINEIKHIEKWGLLQRSAWGCFMYKSLLRPQEDFFKSFWDVTFCRIDEIKAHAAGAVALEGEISVGYEKVKFK